MMFKFRPTSPSLDSFPLGLPGSVNQDIDDFTEPDDFDRFPGGDGQCCSCDEAAPATFILVSSTKTLPSFQCSPGDLGGNKFSRWMLEL